jgi:hypothetical protein
MSAKPTRKHAEIRVTVDGAEFFSFVRALKRSHRASEIGEVVMSVGDRQLAVQCTRGGCVLVCNKALPVVARLSGGGFSRLVSLVKDANASGPLVIVFRPEFGEVSLPCAGAKAKFD